MSKPAFDRWINYQNRTLREFRRHVHEEGNELHVLTLMFCVVPGQSLEEVPHMQRIAMLTDSASTEEVDALVRTAFNDVMERELSSDRPYGVLLSESLGEDTPDAL